MSFLNPGSRLKAPPFADLRQKIYVVIEQGKLTRETDLKKAWELIKGVFDSLEIVELVMAFEETGKKEPNTVGDLLDFLESEDAKLGKK